MSKATEHKTPKGKLPAKDFLRAVPYRNEAMKLTDRRGGAVLAEVPMRKPGWLVPPLSWIIPYSSHRRVELDAAGASVLELCDGRRTVEAVVEKFAADNKLSFREAQLAVMEFLKQLSQRGLIAIVGAREDEDADQQ